MTAKSAATRMSSFLRSKRSANLPLASEPIMQPNSNELKTQLRFSEFLCPFQLFAET